MLKNKKQSLIIENFINVFALQMFLLHSIFLFLSSDKDIQFYYIYQIVFL